MNADTNPHKGRTGIDRIVHAAGYSWSGLKAAYLGESAFRQEVWLCVLAMPFAFWLGRGWVQVSLLLGSLVAVLVVELLNSAVEAVVDRVSFELHDLSKRAKDIASAAVLLSLLFAAGVWGAAIWQHLF
jgi:diacylglycerol kinase (ATP)